MTRSPDYTAAVRAAAARALAVGRVKAAADGDSPTLGAQIGDAASTAWGGLRDAAGTVTDNSFGQSGLIGAGIGAGAGLLRALLTKSRRKRVLGDVLTGGLLGGATGLGVQALRTGVGLQNPDRSTAEKTMKDLSQRATTARRRLGLQGVEGQASDDIATDLVKGTIDPATAKSRLAGHVPSSGSQLLHAVPAAWNATWSGNVGDAAAQLDVLGLKQLHPGSPAALDMPGAVTTLGAGVGANLLTRRLLSPESRPVTRQIQDLVRGGSDALKVFPGSVSSPTAAPGGPPPAAASSWKDLAQNPEKYHTLSSTQKADLRSHLAVAHEAARAKQTTFRRLTGGRLPALAALAPLIGREWFSPHGFRSGNPDLFALAKAHRDAQQLQAQPAPPETDK